MAGSHGATVVVDLATVLGVAGVVGLLARLIALPGIVGYLVAGLIVGPNLPVPIYADPERIPTLAVLGVVLVMFCVGLEFRIGQLLRVLPVSGFAGMVQIGALMWAGFTIGYLLDWTPVASTFLGAALAISSTMVVTGAFAQRPPDPAVRGHALGILVLQDVAAILLVTALTVVAAGGSMEPAALAKTGLGLVATLVGLLAVGALLLPRLVRALVRVGWGESLTVLLVGFAFGYAVLAEALGYSEALGAFVAGMVVAESGEGHAIGERIGSLRDVFAAVFFVSIGMTVDPAAVVEVWPLVLGICATIIVGQLLSVTVGSLVSGVSLPVAVTTALSLGQIGEFSFILAEVGRSAGVVPPSLGPALVAVATITAITSPLLTRAAPRVVAVADHLIPGRVHRLLTIHQRAVVKIRALVGPDLAHWRAALLGVSLDAAGLIVLGVAFASGAGVAARWTAAQLGLDLLLAKAVVGGAALLLAAPLVFGLLLNARRLAELAVDVLVGADPDRPARPLAALVRALVHLAVLLTLGSPAVALLRPWLSAPWAAPTFLAALLAAALVVWRRAGQVDGALRSGVERMAVWVATEGGAAADDMGDGAGEAHAHVEMANDGAASEHPPTQRSLGLDRLPRFILPPASAAVGRTLAELDLRARSGVSVVAILRDATLIPMPSAHEPLRAGDALVLLGADDAEARVAAALG